jgi:hypothetical protein
VFHSSAGIRPRGSTRHSVIFGVGSDPHPRYRVRFEFTQCSIMVADSHCDEVTFALKPTESERGCEGFVRQSWVVGYFEFLTGSGHR